MATDWKEDDALAICMHSLKPSGNGVLTIHYGEVLLINFSSSDWYYGRSLISGVKGLFPKSYVVTLSKHDYPVEYECLRDEVQLEMLTALYQWTEKAKHQICHTDFIPDARLPNTATKNPIGAIQDAIDEFKAYNRRIIFKSDQQRIYKKIDQLNKDFKLPKKFREHGGTPYDLKKVLCINICETGVKLTEKTPLLKSISTDIASNAIYQIVINTRGLQFSTPRWLLKVPLVYVFALVASVDNTLKHISEPIAVRKFTHKSDPAATLKSEDREITFSFTYHWLEKQLKQLGIHEMRLKNDLIGHVDIACWVVSTGTEIKQMRKASAKLEALPDVQIPLFAGRNSANYSFPSNLDWNSKTNTRISLAEVVVDISGKVDLAKVRKYSTDGDMGPLGSTPGQITTVPLSSKKKLTSTHLDGRLSTQSTNELSAGLFHGIGETPLPIFTPPIGGSKPTSRISIEIQPSNVVEIKSMTLKGQTKFIFSCLSVGYANLNASMDSLDNTFRTPEIRILPYENCPNWHSATFECVVEVPSNRKPVGYNMEFAPFLNRCHVMIELESDEHAEMWKKKLPYLVFELRRSKICSDHKDLLSKSCTTESVEAFKIFGYCVIPLFDEVLPSNGEYQLRVLTLQQLKDLLGTKPKPGFKKTVWDVELWALEGISGLAAEANRPAMCSLTVKFSLSSEILMNEGFVPQLLKLPNTLKNLFSKNKAIQPFDLNKSINSITEFLEKPESEREKNINVCLSFMKSMLESLLHSFVFTYRNVEDNEDLLELLIELMIDLCWIVHRKTSRNRTAVRFSRSNQDGDTCDLYAGDGFSLEASLLEAAHIFSDDSKIRENPDLKYMSLAFLTCLENEIQFSINGLGSTLEATGLTSTVDLDDSTSNRNPSLSSPTPRHKIARSKVFDSFKRKEHFKSVVFLERKDSCEKVTPNQTRKHEIIELSHLFLKACLMHFKTVRTRLTIEDVDNFVGKFENILELLYDFLNQLKVPPLHETVALALVHILDDICSFEDDGLTKVAFEMLGKHLDVTAQNNFPQKKNTLLLLLNKLENAHENKLWKTGIEFLMGEVDKEQGKLEGKPPTSSTYAAIVTIISRLLSILSNDEKFRKQREIVLEYFFKDNPDSFVSWFFGFAVEECAKNKNNLDWARSYFGIALSTMEMISNCDRQIVDMHLSDPLSNQRAINWDIIETLIFLARRTQDYKIGDTLQKTKLNAKSNGAPDKLLTQELRITVIRDSTFGRRLFDSDEYISFRVKSTFVVLKFMEQLINSLDAAKLNLAHMGVVVLETISQRFLQPHQFQQKSSISEDLIFPMTQQDFGDLRVMGVNLFVKISSKVLHLKQLSQVVTLKTQKSCEYPQNDKPFVDFVNYCCCYLVRLSVAMEAFVSGPLCKVIISMMADETRLVEQHVISTLIEFDLHRSIDHLQSRINKQFYDQLDCNQLPRDKRLKVEEVKARLKTLIDRQELNFHNDGETNSMTSRADFLASTLRLSFLIKFYSSSDQNQYRMFQDLYLRQMIKILSTADQEDENFYKAEIAQCYAKLAELSDTGSMNTGFSMEKCELLQQAAINFKQSGRLVQAENFLHEIENEFRSKWILKRLQKVRKQLDELYACIIEGNYSKNSDVKTEWFYYIRLYGNIQSIVKDHEFILRLPRSVEVSDVANDISRIFPNIQRQNIGSPTDSDLINPQQAYYQISCTDVQRECDANMLRSKPKTNSVANIASKLTTSMFYSRLNTDSDSLDEEDATYEDALSELSSGSEASVFVAKWVQPNDNVLEKKVVRQTLTVRPSFPYFSPWNTVDEKTERLDSGIVLAMEVLSDSVKSLSQGVEEVRKNKQADRHKNTLRNIICSPVQGGIHMYHPVADAVYASQFDPKEVREMRRMCSELIDKAIDLMDALKPHFLPGEEEIYNEFLFDAKCLFKHASLKVEPEKTEMAYWIAFQKLSIRRLPIAQSDIQTFQSRDAGKQKKLIKGLADYLESLFVTGFNNLLFVAKWCSGAKSTSDVISVTTEQLLWDSLIMVLSRFDPQIGEIGDKTPFTAAFCETYSKMLEFEKPDMKVKILNNLEEVKKQLKLF